MYSGAGRLDAVSAGGEVVRVAGEAGAPRRCGGQVGNGCDVCAMLCYAMLRVCLSCLVCVRVCVCCVLLCHATPRDMYTHRI